MDDNTLRCPQCGSPVLATANYCVICGIRLPDPAAADDGDRPGWESAHRANDPIDPIPPIEIPEYDDPTEDEATIDVEAYGASSETYDPIPDIELDDLDAVIAAEPGQSPETDDDPDAPDEEELEIEQMIEEGGPVVDSEPDEDEDIDDVEAEAEVVEMIDEGGPAASEPADDDTAEDTDTTISDVLAAEADEPEADPDDESSAANDERAEPEGGHLVTDEAAIEMIDEGGPAFGDIDAPEPESDPEDEPETEEVQAEQNTETETDAEESMPSNEIKQETDEDEETEDDDLIASILESSDEPSPMISASYPDESAPAAGSPPQGTGSQHWWPEDNDDDWVYFEPEHIVSTPTSERSPVSTADDTGSDAYERAHALIDELKALIPALGAEVEPPAGPDLSELKTIAIAASGERSFDDWAALRQAVGNAVGRPTDIETILQLSKRVDDISALIVERDRLQDAFTRIIEWIDANESAN